MLNSKYKSWFGLSEQVSGAFYVVTQVTTLALNAGLWFQTRSSRHGLLLAGSIMLLLRGESTYPGCLDFRSKL